MYEKQKPVEKNHLRDVPTPGKYCGVDGCGRRCVVFIKQHNVSRCATCYLRDLDNAGESASLVVKNMMDKRLENASV